MLSIEILQLSWVNDSMTDLQKATQVLTVSNHPIFPIQSFASCKNLEMVGKYLVGHPTY